MSNKKSAGYAILLMDMQFFCGVRGIFVDDDINLHLHVSITHYVMFALYKKIYKSFLANNL